MSPRGTRAAELSVIPVLDALPAGVVVVDEALEPFAANSGFAHMLAVDPSQIVARTVTEALFAPAPGAQPEVLIGAIRRALLGETVRVEQATVAGTRGVLRRIAWASPVALGDGHTDQVLVLFPIEEERFQVLLENTTDVITVLDPDGTIRYSNPAAGDLMGYAEGIVLAGSSAFDLVHPDDRDRAVTVFQERLRQPGVGPAEEIRVRSGDGSWHTMEISLANLVDHPGIGGVVITMHDITERKRFEEQLAQREHHFRSLVENLNDVIVVLDGTATVVYASPAIERIIGAPVDTNIGQNAFNDIHPDDRHEAIAAFEQLTKEPGAVSRMEIRLRNVVKDRWTWVEVTTVNRLHDPGVEGVICTLRDITTVKQAELVKDQFLATVSHEMRTPLTSIVGFTDVLRHEKSIDDDTRSKLLERVAANADQMSEMVEQVLNFSRLEAGRALVDPVPVEVGEAIRSCLRELERQLAHHVVDVDVPTGLRVVADRDALGHVLRNLLTNAAKFAPGGSRIRIKAERLDGVVAFSVSDEGPGVPPEDRSRIFERFTQGGRVTPGHRGTGLGLSIARQYVELQGGRIWLESDVDRGATFSFILPAVGSRTG